MPLQDKTTPNPLRGENSVLTFETTGVLNFNKAHFSFSYIPDRDIISQTVFNDFFEQQQQEAKQHKSENAEQLASTVLKHFYNEILPFWVRLTLTIPHETGAIQRVQVVKQQPNYKIPQELTSLLEL